MRWTKRIWTTALLLAGLAGCKQQCFIKECDWNHTRDNLAGMVEFMPEASQTPSPSVVHTEPVRTILDPDRPVRYLSLAEAISVALERGTRGSLALNGQGDDTLVTFPGAAALQSDQIRVLALDPAIQAASIELSLSKFDAVFETSMQWNVTDRPIGTALDAFQAGRTGALNAIQTDSARFVSALAKPLPTGGIAGITFSTDYQFTNLPAAVNPSYTPRLQFLFEQPLLQGFGVEVNQIRTAHPGPSGLLADLARTDRFAPQGVEGILISRIRYDQSRAEFERSVAQMVLNVEVAYWNLYGSYWNLYSREQGLRLAFESWRVTRSKYLVGGVKRTTLADVARTRGQYELFRGQRIDALGRVLEAERQLRKLLGYPVEDGCRLVPSDTPTLAPYQPDYCAALEEAIRLRPELVVAREDLKVQQLRLIDNKNRLLPDLRTFASYDINSIGSELSGPSNRNAFRNLAENNFNSWTLGLRMAMPIGFRAAHAELRQARLNVARSLSLLRDQELKAEQFLALQYRRLFEFYEQIKAQRAQREAYGLQLRLTFELVLGDQITLDDQRILEAQRFFAEALANEYNAIVQYNNTLATFEYAKGTLLHHNNVMIGEGPLPCCAAERAAEHHARRNVALVLKEKAKPIHCADGSCAPNSAEHLLPNLPEHKPASLPALFEKMPKLPDDREMSDLPSPGKNLLFLPQVPVSKGAGSPPASGGHPMGSRPEKVTAAPPRLPSWAGQSEGPDLAPPSLGASLSQPRTP